MHPVVGNRLRLGIRKAGCTENMFHESLLRSPSARTGGLNDEGQGILPDNAAGDTLICGASGGEDAQLPVLAYIQ
jgi:hypothetical protein